MNKLNRIFTVASITALLLVIVALLIAPAAQATPPTPGTTRGSYVVNTFFNKPITVAGSTQITYTAVPLIVKGSDIAASAYWYQVDTFVTVDVSGTSIITVTPQYGVDTTNFASGAESVTFTADGTKYLQSTLVGTTLRYMIETTGTVTVTVKAAYKNTGGQ